jgi:hypothetical protein
MSSIPSILRGALGNAGQKFRRLHFERMRQLADGVKRRALLGALQYADVVSVQIGHFREFLLGNTLGQPKLPQALPKELPLLLNAHE